MSRSSTTPHTLPAVLVLAALQGCAGGPAPSETVEATGAALRAVRITSVDDPGLELLDRERAALREAGMTRVAMPFGVLLAADAGMPPAYFVEAAAILAEMMDQDLDGVADDSMVAAALARCDVAWPGTPMDSERWEGRAAPPG